VGIKLDSVISDVKGKAARRMLDALIAGRRDPSVMADMALTRMRPKIAELRLVLEGRFDQHHALMLSFHLGHIDQLTATIERLDAEVDGRGGDRRVAHTLVVIIWHVLANGVSYKDLGSDYFDRRDATVEIRRHVAALQRLGQRVTLTPAA
jgi:hypothetical protein